MISCFDSLRIKYCPQFMACYMNHVRFAYEPSGPSGQSLYVVNILINDEKKKENKSPLVHDAALRV